MMDIHSNFFLIYFSQVLHISSMQAYHNTVHIHLHMHAHELLWVIADMCANL